MVDARERGTTEPRVVGHEYATQPRVGRLGVATAGLVAVIVSAWGGIIPYVGPLFGFSGDGTNSWHWSLPHSVLALVPGAAGVLLGLFVMGTARGASMMRGRMTLSMAGFLLMVCGAWFAIGPLAWPVIYHGDTYFVHTASHLRLLAYEVGYSIGTGLVVMGCGGFVSGWASRHQRRATLATAPAEAAAPAAEPVESGI